jgi:diguanylate cyclase (GGDEF)-like protein
LGTGGDPRCRHDAFDSELTGRARRLTDTTIDDFFQQLRREYLAEAPARVGELRKDLAALRVGEPDAGESLKTRFHRLAGSGGSYGFPPISVAAREAERWLMTSPAPDGEGLGWLDQAIARVAAAFDDAARAVGLPNDSPRAMAFGWRAHLLGAPADLAARLTAVLTDAQYTVTAGSLDLDPASITASERPDIVVFAPPVERDSSQAVSRWAAAALGRRVGMALVHDPLGIDILSPPWSRLDLVADPAGAEAEIGRWAQVEGRVASSPMVALVISGDDETRATFAGWLEAAGIRPTTAADLREAMAALDKEQPDLILVDWETPEGDVAGFVRRLRRMPRLALAPIVAVIDQALKEQRIAALEAGAEDVLVRPVDRTLFVATSVPRAARARHLAEVVRRDTLTGFLTPSALLDEMESVFAYARRTGERLSFVLFDIDHLRRINEQLGHPAGDQVLTCVARLVRDRGRASDVFARLGGEEFGILLRRCGVADAVTVAENIRSALAAKPAIVDGAPLPVRLSAGVASYPDHAVGVRELLLASERALRAAKEGGRDKVVVA